MIEWVLSVYLLGTHAKIKEDPHPYKTEAECLYFAKLAENRWTEWPPIWHRIYSKCEQREVGTK